MSAQSQIANSSRHSFLPPSPHHSSCTPGTTEIIDCCVVTQSTITTHCQEGDVIVRINEKDCYCSPAKPSDLIASGAAAMVKTVEKLLNREKGSRTVRFLRLSDGASAGITSKKVAVKQLTSQETALLLQDIPADKVQAIEKFIVDNNKGNTSYRNSISRMDSLSLSLSLLMSPSRKFSVTETPEKK
jgi:hypothetical protein